MEEQEAHGGQGKWHKMCSLWDQMEGFERETNMLHLNIYVNLQIILPF